MMDTITYIIDNKLYVNLTNRCSNDCDFCVRNSSESYETYHLWLTKEPTTEEVIADLKNLEGIKEVVFCGFGEPLYRLDAIIEIAKYVHTLGVPTRINTNGQAKFISGFDTASQLEGCIDTINVSLNATDAKKYQDVCHSVFGEEAFSELLRFASDCLKYIPNVILSIVDCVGAEEVAQAELLANKIGAKLRVRAYIS